MRGDEFFSQTLGERGSRPFRQAAGIDNNQGRAVLFDQLLQAIVNFLPDFSRHGRFPRQAGHLDLQIPRGVKEPVGAAIKADSPAQITDHAWRWASEDTEKWVLNTGRRRDEKVLKPTFWIDRSFFKAIRDKNSRRFNGYFLGSII
jgi:hypothetical protein